MPNVPQPAAPASGLPGVRQLRRPRGRRAGRCARARSRARPRVAPADGLMSEPVVAVDCNGADLGPAEVAAGAALAAAQGARVLLFGPAGELGTPPPGVEIVDAPVSIAKAADPVAAARARGDASIVLATKAVGEGRAQALVCAGGTGAAVPAGTFNIKRDRGID